MISEEKPGLKVLQFLSGPKFDPFAVLDLDLLFSPDISSIARFFGDNLHAGKAANLDLFFFGQGFFEVFQDAVHDRQRFCPIELSLIFDFKGNIVLDHEVLLASSFYE